jgi:hypothetical protein
MQGLKDKLNMASSIPIVSTVIKKEEISNVVIHWAITGRASNTVAPWSVHSKGEESGK